MWREVLSGVVGFCGRRAEVFENAQGKSFTMTVMQMTSEVEVFEGRHKSKHSRINANSDLP